MIEEKIFLSLVNISEVPITAYELIRLLTRRFKIYNFIDVANQCLNNNYVEKINIPSRQMPSYKLTEKGKRELNKINKIDFEMELKVLYPEEIEFIKLLIR